MSEHTNGQQSPSVVRPSAESSSTRDMAEVDCSGLARAIELLNSSNLVDTPILALVRQELARVQQQVDSLLIRLQKSSVELRQLRDTTQSDMQGPEEQRQLQDHNDHFVANLIHDHEVELAATRRERDAAIDRVRELSREIGRVGTSSSANLARASDTRSLRATSGSMEVAELKARVDELIRERERSVRLLRQLAEQRDSAEARLQEILASAGAGAPQSLPHRAARAEPIIGLPARVDITRERPSESTPTASIGPGSHEPATSNPVVVRPPALPSVARESTSKRDILDDPNAWDLPQGADPADALNTAALTSSQMDVQAKDQFPLAANGTAIRQADALANVAGTYSMRTEDLASEAVFVLRSAKNRPKNP